MLQKLPRLASDQKKLAVALGAENGEQMHI